MGAKKGQKSRGLFQVVGGVAEEVEEGEVAEELELLADFGSDVGRQKRQPLNRRL